MNRLFSACGAAISLSLSACAPSLLNRPQDDGDGPTGHDTADTADPADPVRVSSTPGDGETVTLVDATEYLEFVYFSFATGEQVHPEDPLSSLEWDLGFERYLVSLNGGVSGPGGGVAVALPEADWSELSQAPGPEAAWLEDLPDDDDENLTPEYALGDWFDYDPEDHAVTPSDILFVVRAVSGDYYKLQFLAYYDDAGTPAWLKFRWASVDPPASAFAVNRTE